MIRAHQAPYLIFSDATSYHWAYCVNMLDGRLFLLLASHCLFFLNGCSGSANDAPARAEVSGHVSYDGTPINEGTITFSPISPTTGPSAGAKIVDGAYHMPLKSGPVLGSHRVSITAYQKTGRKIEAGTPSPPGTMVEEIKSIIPEEYNQKSDLTVELANEEKFEINFDLEKK